MSNPDHLLHWAANLAGEKPAIVDGMPQCGFYRYRRNKDAPWLPVLIRKIPRDLDPEAPRAKGLVCRVGDELVDPITYLIRVAHHPISEELWRHHAETGRWPGEGSVPSPHTNGTEGAAAPGLAASPPPTGHNEPPTGLEAEAQAAHEGVDAFLKGLKDGELQTAEQVQIAVNKVGVLREIFGRAEAQHTERKAPHLKAGQAVDKWFREHFKETILVDANKLRAAIARHDGRKAQAIGTSEPIKHESHTGRAITTSFKPQLILTDQNKLLAHYAGLTVKSVARGAFDPRLVDALVAIATEDWKSTGKLVPGTDIQQVPKAA